MSQEKVYQIVTDAIIEKLNQGVIPWHKPWHVAGGGIPMNYVSKKPYQGINTILTGMQDFTCPYWVTFKQCQDLGGNIRAGEKSTIVTFWKEIEKEKDDTGNVTDSYWVIRYYRVFNLEQTENIEYEKPVPVELSETQKILACDNVINNYKGRPEIRHGGARAYYRPSTDHIQMPPENSFESAEEYYNTLFHECIHSTGHVSRLNRLENDAAFGNAVYSKEELTAEMGASFLCALTGIEQKTIDNSAAYIQSWLKVLKNDCKMVIQAAGKAQKAVEFIQAERKEVVKTVKNTVTEIKKALPKLTDKRDHSNDYWSKERCEQRKREYAGEIAWHRMTNDKYMYSGLSEQMSLGRSIHVIACKLFSHK